MKQIKIIIAALAVAAICLALIGSHITRMPKVTDMDLSDAVSVIEEDGILEDDDMAASIRIIDSKTGESVRPDNYQDYFNYMVTGQSPDSHSKVYKYFHLFGKAHFIQITLEVERLEE